jgi:hypothetical protein
MSEFKPVFKYGDNKELLAFLKTKNKGEKPYPLIWLVYPYVEDHGRTNVSIEPISLVLAVRTNKSMLNEQRMEETYKKVLIPLYNNLREMFMQSNIAYVTDEYIVTKFPNYSNEESEGTQNQTVDLWDALKMTFNCTINANCLNELYI